MEGQRDKIVNEVWTFLSQNVCVLAAKSQSPFLGIGVFKQHTGLVFFLFFEIDYLCSIVQSTLYIAQVGLGCADVGLTRTVHSSTVCRLISHRKRLELVLVELPNFQALGKFQIFALNFLLRHSWIRTTCRAAVALSYVKSEKCLVN